jgi:hypothetical protein
LIFQGGFSTLNYDKSWDAQQASFIRKHLVVKPERIAALCLEKARKFCLILNTRKT